MGLFSDSNLWLFIFCFLPGIIYSFIVYANTPYKSVRLKYAFNYLFIGFLSAIFVLGFHLLFPNWTSPLFTQFYLSKNVLVEGPTLLTFFFNAFIQIALVEELAKLGAFRIADARNKEESPISTMFNFMMIGTGFAVVENIMYGFNYGTEVLLIRNFTALIMHMTLGIMIGYFIAIGKQDTEIADKTNLHIFLKTHPRWKKNLYAITGILVASLFHGIYDFNLSFEHANIDILSLFILGSSLYVAYRMAKDLLSIHNSKMLPKKK